MSAFGFGEASFKAMDELCSDKPVIAGLVSISALTDLRLWYEFPEQHQDFGAKSYEVHIASAEVGQAPEVLRDIGNAAVLFAKTLPTPAGFAVGVTYPEIAASAVRLGMTRTPVISKDPMRVLKTEESWDEFRERNGRPLGESLGSQVTVFMQTYEFIEKFSRFAE